jgi:CrcB protein
VELRLLLLVGAGGSVGAVFRYVVAGLAARWDGFPTGTFVVNVVGSSLLSVAAFSSSGVVWYFFNTGVLGAFTTFSTFSYETFRMLEAGEWKLALLNVLGNVVFCILGVLAGRWFVVDVLRV